MTNRHETLGRDIFPLVQQKKQAYIFTFWHNRLMLPLHFYRHTDIGALISQSRDGELITQGAERFGYVISRGSASRGGSTGILGLIAHLKRGNSVIITPDGPRGPRETVQMGVIHLARITEIPVTPVSFSCTRHVRLNSWDRFMLPLPFGRIVTVIGEDIPIAKEAEGESLEHCRKQVEMAIRETTRIADEATGTAIIPYPDQE